MSWGSGWWLSFLVTNRPPVVHKHQEKNLTAWACPSCQGPTKAICSGEHEHSGSSDSLKKIAVLFYNTGQLLRAAIGCLWFCKDSYVDFSVRDIKLFLLFLFIFLTDFLFFPVLRQGWRWPWISDLSASISQVLGLQMCPTALGLYSTEDPTQGFLHASQVLNYLHTPPVSNTVFLKSTKVFSAQK